MPYMVHSLFQMCASLHATINDLLVKLVHFGVLETTPNRALLRRYIPSYNALLHLDKLTMSTGCVRYAAMLHIKSFGIAENNGNTSEPADPKIS